MMGYTFGILFLIALVLVVISPTIIDILFAYTTKRKIIKLIMSRNSGESGQIPIAELRKLGTRAPTGVIGITRATLALAVVLILGLSLVFIMVYGINAEQAKIVNNILSMLSGLLAAVVGFYFGNRAAESKPGLKDDDSKKPDKENQ